MTQWLPRGTKIKGNSIRKLLFGDDQWQIYETGMGRSVLAVREELYSQWIRDEWLPGGGAGSDLFSTWVEDPAVRIYCAKGSAIISSLLEGPYPNDLWQVNAFAAAFRKAVDKDPKADLTGALFLQEPRLLLPTSFPELSEDSDKKGKPSDAGYPNDILFGRWLTGGVPVSIEDIEEIHELTTWLEEEDLRRIAQEAGFKPENRRGAGSTASRTKTGVRSADPDTDSGEQEPGGQSVIRAKEDRMNLPEEPFRLPGQRALAAFLNEEIIDVIRRFDEYERMGIGFPGATVLYGPPGTGKTFAVEKLAEYLGWPRYDINSDSIGSTYIHETGMKIARMFDAAIRNAPSVLVIDEMEAWLSKRTGAGTGWHHVEEVSEFLRKIPEAIDKHVLIFAMTNVIKEIDPAVLRRGRFDYQIEVLPAGKEDIGDLLVSRLQELPADPGIRIDSIAAKLAGHPLSDVAFVLREAGKLAVKSRRKEITQEHLEQALRMVPGSRKESRTVGFSVPK